MTNDVRTGRPGFNGVAGHRSSEVPTYQPGIWRVINDLWQDQQAHPGAPARQYPLVTRVLNRQQVEFCNLQFMEREGIVRGMIGADWIDVRLTELSWGQVTAAKRSLQVRVSLTKYGRTLALDPLNMVLRSAGRRPRRYTVADVTRSAGVSGPDVKPVLVAMEALGLIEACNDQGVVQLAMWKRAEIPSTLRLRLTRKGGTYLNRK